MVPIGELAEWLKAAVLKTVVGVSLPGVRIPRSPPFLVRNLAVMRGFLLCLTWFLPNLQNLQVPLDPIQHKLHRNRDQDDAAQAHKDAQTCLAQKLAELRC